MPVVESQFENEAELETWAFLNLQQFLGPCIRLGKFQVATSSGKTGFPDGFAFNLDTQEWYLLECELLKHGVWPHIAEQITRFVVALQNPDTSRTIRDHLFEKVIETGNAQQIAHQIGTTPERLLQQIELFIEGVQPQIVIFIDDTNQDLIDFAHGLATSVRVYRVKKLLIDGKAEYYSPDRAAPAVATTPETAAPSGSQAYTVIEQLGGGRPITGHGTFVCYELADGRVVHVKYSKFHAKQNYYWYGINPNTLKQAEELNVTHLAFILGDWGFALLPIAIVKAFCEHSATTLNPDGTIRHYHALISPPPEPVMYWSNDVPSYNLAEYCQPFE
jgi:hypothetical protein